MTSSYISKQRRKKDCTKQQKSRGRTQAITMAAQQDVPDEIQQAIDSADPYRRQGTAYLHTRDDRNDNDPRTENPTGAVVVPISLATTFQQSTPGEATAKDDPNSFGAGYEYSRTGKCCQFHNNVT